MGKNELPAEIWDLGFDELFSDNSELRVASERDDGNEMSEGVLVGWF